MGRGWPLSKCLRNQSECSGARHADETCRIVFVSLSVSASVLTTGHTDRFLFPRETGRVCTCSSGTKCLGTSLSPAWRHSSTISQSIVHQLRAVSLKVAAGAGFPATGASEEDGALCRCASVQPASVGRQSCQPQKRGYSAEEKSTGYRG